MPARQAALGRPRGTELPSTVRDPLASTTPQMALRKVVLPLPFGPTRPSSSLSPSSRETPLTALTPPKVTVMSSALSMGHFSATSALELGATQPNQSLAETNDAV